VGNASVGGLWGPPYPSNGGYSGPVEGGVAALVLGKNGSLTPAQVRSILTASAQDLGVAGYDTTFGYGLVDATAALAATP